MQTLNFSILEGCCLSFFFFFKSLTDYSSEDKNKGGGKHDAEDAEEKLTEICFICQQDQCQLVPL